MGRRTDQRKKGQTSSYKRAMYRNLVTDLLGYEKITTTEARARIVRGLAEEMITLGKKRLSSSQTTGSVIHFR